MKERERERKSGRKGDVGLDKEMRFEGQVEKREGIEERDTNYKIEVRKRRKETYRRIYGSGDCKLCRYLVST